MAKKSSYADFLKKDFDELFDSMQLSSLQRHFLRSRWLEQVLWMEKKAAECRDWHYRLRLTAIVLGVIVPILVGLDIGNENTNKVRQYVAIALSSLVAVSAAVEEFFHYGERWNNYRRTVESLKTQGWQFSQLSGPYVSYKSHAEAFSIFADQVEQLIQKDVENYVTQITNQDDAEKSVLDPALQQSFKEFLSQYSPPEPPAKKVVTEPTSATDSVSSEPQNSTKISSTEES